MLSIMVKRLDPALWASARLEWENSDLTFTQVADRLSVSLPTVSIRARRELWVKGDGVDLQRIDFSPTQLVDIAVRALVRACNQTKDHASAIKAASLLLDRALGRVLTEAKPMLTPEDVAAGSLPPPPWLDQGRRLVYQAAEAIEALPMSE